MKTGVKTWRESEIVMTLATLKEKAEQYRKAIPVLKEAELDRAAKAMSELLEVVGKHIRQLNKELDSRRPPEPGPKNMSDAFRL